MTVDKEVENYLDAYAKDWKIHKCCVESDMKYYLVELSEELNTEHHPILLIKNLVTKTGETIDIPEEVKKNTLDGSVASKVIKVFGAHMNLDDVFVSGPVLENYIKNSVLDSNLPITARVYNVLLHCYGQIAWRYI